MTTTESAAGRAARTVSSEGPRDRAVRTDETVEALKVATSRSERSWLRDQLVLINLPVARSIALRYQGRGEQVEDLEQVARLALVKAAATFDPEQGTFLAYAVPGMAGEVKRYFRDHGWHVRPPRRLQELRPAIARSSSELAQQLGRTPGVAEVAEHLGADLDDVIEFLNMGHCYRADSLDDPFQDHDGAVPPRDLLGDVDPRFALLDDLLALRPLLDALPERERKVLILVYVKGWSQDQVGAEIGVSQMQVSRILAKTLRGLRRTLTDAADLTARPSSS